jgi:hypothetical protein
MTNSIHDSKGHEVEGVLEYPDFGAGVRGVLYIAS